ncbi:hypothetical protein [Synechococcus sp. CC9311]|nr:hypothetical protein [Synechococcus sp. CC9311]
MITMLRYVKGLFTSLDELDELLLIQTIADNLMNEQDLADDQVEGKDQ